MNCFTRLLLVQLPPIFRQTVALQESQLVITSDGLLYSDQFKHSHVQVTQPSIYVSISTLRSYIASFTEIPNSSPSNQENNGSLNSETIRCSVDGICEINATSSMQISMTKNSKIQNEYEQQQQQFVYDLWIQVGSPV
ncbi:unnamed protein product [Adineta steineri]|uniref:Uncharacterized protein n=1 Tax=Adineta steineri TaxID=433720 RepID=A0A814LHT5_9BILA|nr:unnamed protein product [Adineta steineri]